MPGRECNQCGMALPQVARFCRKCGIPLTASRLGAGSIGVRSAWIAGICFWLITGVVMAVAGPEGRRGLEAGAEFLFCALFFVGIVAGGIQLVKGLARFTAAMGDGRSKLTCVIRESSKS